MTIAQKILLGILIISIIVGILLVKQNEGFGGDCQWWCEDIGRGNDENCSWNACLGCAFCYTPEGIHKGEQATKHWMHNVERSGPPAKYFPSDETMNAADRLEHANVAQAAAEEIASTRAADAEVARAVEVAKLAAGQKMCDQKREDAWLGGQITGGLIGGVFGGLFPIPVIRDGIGFGLEKAIQGGFNSDFTAFDLNTGKCRPPDELEMSHGWSTKLQQEQLLARRKKIIDQNPYIIKARAAQDAADLAAAHLVATNAMSKDNSEYGSPDDKDPSEEAELRAWEKPWMP